MPEARTPRYLHRSHREVMFGFSLIDFWFVQNGCDDRLEWTWSF